MDIIIEKRSAKQSTKQTRVHIYGKKAQSKIIVSDQITRDRYDIYKTLILYAEQSIFEFMHFQLYGTIYEVNRDILLCLCWKNRSKNVLTVIHENRKDYKIKRGIDYYKYRRACLKQKAKIKSGTPIE